MTVSDYSIQANSNSRISGINIAENCPPSTLNNALRQMMADLRLYANDAGWFAFGSGDVGVRASLDRASNGDILLSGGDFTTSYSATRRVRVRQLPSSYYYGTIVSSAFSLGTLTTVKVSWDRGVIPGGPYDSIALGVDPASCSATALLPTATILYIASLIVPAGFLPANGQLVERASYPGLFSVLGTTFGSTTATNFSLPDLRGEFIRGLDNGRNLDYLRTLGSVQTSQNKSHSHSFNGVGIATSSKDRYSNLYGFAGGTQTVDSSNITGNRSSGSDSLGSINADGSDESRPHNVAMLAIIKT